MRKKILAILISALVIAPCLLTFSCGPNAPYGIESLGWPNLVGFGWFCFLVFGGFRRIVPTWVYDEVKDLAPEEDEW